MSELVSAIAKSLVEHPEAVEVSESQSNGTTIIQLKVASDDMGKVIGKQGRRAAALTEETLSMHSLFITCGAKSGLQRLWDCVRRGKIRGSWRR